MRAELAITEQGSSVWAQSKHEVNNLLLLSTASKVQNKDEIAVEQPKRCTINHSLYFLPICTDWEQFYTPCTQQRKPDTAFCWEGGEEEKGRIFTMLFSWRNTHTYLVTAEAQFAPPGLHLLNWKQMWQNYWRQSPIPTVP